MCSFMASGSINVSERKVSSSDIVRISKLRRHDGRVMSQARKRRQIHTKCLGEQSTCSMVMLKWFLGEYGVVMWMKPSGSICTT